MANNDKNILIPIVIGFAAQMPERVNFHTTTWKRTNKMFLAIAKHTGRNSLGKLLDDIVDQIFQSVFRMTYEEWLEKGQPVEQINKGN